MLTREDTQGGTARRHEPARGGPDFRAWAGHDPEDSGAWFVAGLPADERAREPDSGPSQAAHRCVDRRRAGTGREA